MNKPLGDAAISPEALRQMKEIGGEWAAYQNHALGSALIGHLQFLKIGKDCTYAEPPERYPADTAFGMGWRYLHVGAVNFETGGIT